MAAFVDKCGVYVQHQENIIADTSKQTDKAKLEGKRRKMVRASVLLKCYLFLDLLDSAKNFSLASQYANSDIINMVDRINDMKLTYQLFYRKFEKSPESVFELPRLEKLLNSVKWKTAMLPIKVSNYYNFSRQKEVSKAKYCHTWKIF